MDQKQAVQKVKQFAEAARQHLPVCEFWLYGSYAKGCQRRWSDIDVAVVVDAYKGDLLSMWASLCGLGMEIDTRIEPLLLERKHDPAHFLEEIHRTGRLIASYS